MGGEQSGHIIFSDHNTTGDGILGALQVLSVMKRREKPLSMLAKIFEPFFTTRNTGTGLGLSIVKKLSQAMGGTVKVESTVNVGTVFTVELPLQPVMNAQVDSIA